MLVVLSPAKTLDLDPSPLATFSQPQALDESQSLVDGLKALSVDDIGTLMKLSPKLASLNHERYAEYRSPFELGSAKQALLTFKGDSYLDFELQAYSDEDYAWAQRHLRILSGLYGALRPLDLIRPYRLEMGTRFANARGKNLYEFWGERIQSAIADAIEASEGDKALVNLASNEYFRSVKSKSLNARVIQIVFEDFKRDRYKVISFFAKRARGAMANWILRERITRIDDLQRFTGRGYAYDAEHSQVDTLVFRRAEAA